MYSAAYYFLEFSAIFIIVGWGIYIIYRQGQICYTPFLTMIIGAYFTALSTRDWSWPFGLALLASVGLAALFAFVSGIFLTKLGALPMILVTIALIFIIQTVIRNLDFLGGVWGFWHIPAVEHLVPITYCLLFVIGFFVYRLGNYRLGRAMDVAFVDREVASGVGVNLFRLSVSVQVIGGIMGGVAGALWAPLTTSINVNSFGFPTLLLIICFLFVGGHTTMWGVVVFAPILYAVRLLLPTSVAAWGNVIFGVLLICILLARPEGVIDRRALQRIRSSSKALLKRLRGRKSNG